jgi:hypothetical protein
LKRTDMMWNTNIKNRNSNKTQYEWN